MSRGNIVAVPSQKTACHGEKGGGGGRQGKDRGHAQHRTVTLVRQKSKSRQRACRAIAQACLPTPWSLIRTRSRPDLPSPQLMCLPLMEKYDWIPEDLASDMCLKPPVSAHNGGCLCSSNKRAHFGNQPNTEHRHDNPQPVAIEYTVEIPVAFVYGRHTSLCEAGTQRGVDGWSPGGGAQVLGQEDSKYKKELAFVHAGVDSSVSR